jgi:hypothetical protein
MIEAILDTKMVAVSGKIVPFIHIDSVPFVCNNLKMSLSELRGGYSQVILNAKETRIQCDEQFLAQSTVDFSFYQAKHGTWRRC